MTEQRRTEIGRLVRRQVIDRLKEDLDGGEDIMKEVWEEMASDEEERRAKQELRAIIAAIKNLGTK